MDVDYWRHSVVTHHSPSESSAAPLRLVPSSSVASSNEGALKKPEAVDPQSWAAFNVGKAGKFIAVSFIIYAPPDYTL